MSATFIIKSTAGGGSALFSIFDCSQFDYLGLVVSSADTVTRTVSLVLYADDFSTVLMAASLGNVNASTNAAGCIGPGISNAGLNLYSGVPLTNKAGISIPANAGSGAITLWIWGRNIA